MFNKKSILLFIAFIACSLAYIPSIYHFQSFDQQTKAFQQELTKKETQGLKILAKTAQWDRRQLLHKQVNQLNKQYKQEGFSVFVFHRNKLDFWTEDATIIKKSKLLNADLIYTESNAWQVKHRLRRGDSTYVVLFLIKHNYQLQNRFLKNNFHHDFQFSNIKNISSTNGKCNTIYNKSGQALFCLTSSKAIINNNLQEGIGLLFLFGLITILVTLPQLLTKRKSNQSLLSIALFMGIRGLLFISLPLAWQNSPFFQSNYFAISNFIPSLGDLILHLITLFAILYALKKILKRSKNTTLAILLPFIACGFSWFSIKLVGLSISSSQINFNLNNLFQLNELSVSCYIAFVLLFICNLLLIHLSTLLISNRFSIKKGKLIYSIVLITYLIFILANPQDQLIGLWVIPVFIIMQGFSSRLKSKLIGTSILILICCAATLSYWSNLKIEQKKNASTTILLKKLAEEEDPIAEYLFQEAQSEIRKDTFLLNHLNSYWENKELVDQKLKQRYFNAYWDRYEILFSICDKQDSLYISNWDASVSCLDYFQNRIRLEGTAVSSNNLFQLKNLAGRVDYIGEILLKKDSTTYQLYVELGSNYFNENEGYPELLLDANSKTKNINLNGFDYAVYENGNLVFKNGDYNYSTSLKINELSAQTYYKYDTRNFHHTIYQKNKDTSIVLSYPSTSTIDFFTAFAYLLVLFSLIFIACSLGLRDFPFYFRPQWSDFSFKIQLFLIGSILTALILVAIGSTYYIQKQYQAKNSANLGEKLRSIKLEMENKVGREEILSPELQGHISGLLVNFSNVFYTDINFYNKQGKLYASSRPEIFKKGLKSEQMNPVAYRKIAQSEKAEWVQEESIGEMEYLSAYIPFKNYDNQVLGYLNLPYFVKQGKLQEEISNFLVSTINIYVAVFAIALFISILLINQLSKPLLLIRNQIAKLKLGSSIELIEWKSKDEIGALVKEYNRIAIELNESAERLAQSEREGAWREMAKQVAHEIKNPLTPMKLSIQHLQRAADMNSADLTVRIKRTTQTLIEQIETLSNIATAFSSFAKLPERTLIKIDLIPILKNLTDLYSGDAKTEFKLVSDISTAIINADKDQLLRLMNNLLKNAMQACSENEEAHISITLKKEINEYIVLIEDNGNGIPEDQIQKIFEPNFTTKSSGTGLGLAMTKNMVEQLGGSINVESTVGLGTTFYVHLPIA